MGGQNVPTYYKSVELYNLEENSWSSLPQLTVPRSEAGCCQHAGYVYLFGGLTTNRHYLKSFERLKLVDL